LPAVLSRVSVIASKSWEWRRGWRVWTVDESLAGTVYAGHEIERGLCACVIYYDIKNVLSFGFRFNCCQRAEAEALYGPMTTRLYEPREVAERDSSSKGPGCARWVQGHARTMRVPEVSGRRGSSWACLYKAGVAAADGKGHMHMHMIRGTQTRGKLVAVAT